MSTTIASASVLRDGTLAILVEAAEAASLAAFLQSENIDYLGPNDVIWRPRRVTRNASGQLQLEEGVLVSEIIAQGTPEDFSAWMAKWILPRQMR